MLRPALFAAAVVALASPFYLAASPPRPKLALVRDSGSGLYAVAPADHAPDGAAMAVRCVATACLRLAPAGAAF